MPFCAIPIRARTESDTTFLKSSSAFTQASSSSMDVNCVRGLPLRGLGLASAIFQKFSMLKFGYPFTECFLVFQAKFIRQLLIALSALKVGTAFSLKATGYVIFLPVLIQSPPRLKTFSLMGLFYLVYLEGHIREHLICG